MLKYCIAIALVTALITVIIVGRQEHKVEEYNKSTVICNNKQITQHITQIQFTREATIVRTQNGGYNRCMIFELIPNTK